MFKEKLFKKLYENLEGLQLQNPTPLQLQSFSSIQSGANVIIHAPEKSGKSTLLSISAIQNLKRPMDEAPKVLIIVGTAEKGKNLVNLLEQLATDTGLRVNSAFEGGDLDEDAADIYEGTDIVVGTAKQVLDIYFSRSLNLNKIKLFILDDPEWIIKNAWQGHIDRLALSLPKCQRLVFTTELNDKIEKLISKFMVAPKRINLFN